MAVSLPYGEPDIVTILTYSSFLLLLVSINHVVDRIIYCGLVGQILIGVLFGAPGAQWLSLDFQHLVVQLGYLGLTLIVYEGGLSTSFSSLKANLLLSACVALTGIAAPIGLSFVLTRIADASPLQTFAAGAALCSTSLGTTFAVLNASGLAATRLGVVLSTAAMLDDVVGLVMVQVISNLGGPAQSFEATTVIRPVFVSLGFAAVVPLICWTLVKPMIKVLGHVRLKHGQSLMVKLSSDPRFVFCLHTLYLLGMITAASYAGTSNLFAAYIAGASITWCDTEMTQSNSVIQEVVNKPIGTTDHQDTTSATSEAELPSEPTESVHTKTSGRSIFEHYYQPALTAILKPLFFASIGFSIPITRMFAGNIVWRGIVFTLLMAFGKLLCGLWLVRIHLPHDNISPPILSRIRRLPSKFDVACWIPRRKNIPGSKATETAVDRSLRRHGEAIELQSPDRNLPAESSPDPTALKPSPPTTSLPSPAPPLPHTIYPSLILGSAMTARGEIGFLISSLAESSGIFQQSQAQSSAPSSAETEVESDIFLIITWAIMLCTVVGPLMTGLLVRRVRRMEIEKGSGRRDVLGVWGVS